MKKTFIAALLATMSMTPVQAQTDLGELSKELEIMSNILSTSLRQDSDRKGIRFRKIDTTYLEEQGVVFEIGTTNGGWQFSFDWGGLVQDLPGLIAPEPPVAPHAQEFHVQIDEDALDDFVQDAMSEAQDAMRELQDRLRELRDREREYSWEQREYERRRRDLEFERRNANEDRRKELEERTQELEREVQELERKRSEVNQYAEEIEQEQKKKREERQAARQQQYKRFLADFEANVGDVLCKYGAGIKALPKDENISFVLKNFGGSARSDGNKDRIYVFSNQDVQSCVKDKIDANKLLEKSSAYLF